MKEVTFTVWISKYAITRGIYAEEVCSTNFNDMVATVTDHRPFIKPHWHLTKEEAVDQAEEMRISKLKSLDSQIKKISALKF